MIFKGLSCINIEIFYSFLNVTVKYCFRFISSMNHTVRFISVHPIRFISVMKDTVEIALLKRYSLSPV